LLRDDLFTSHTKDSVDLLHDDVLPSRITESVNLLRDTSTSSINLANAPMAKPVQLMHPPSKAGLSKYSFEQDNATVILDTPSILPADPTIHVSPGSSYPANFSQYQYPVSSQSPAYRQSPKRAITVDEQDENETKIKGKRQKLEFDEMSERVLQLQLQIDEQKLSGDDLKRQTSTRLMQKEMELHHILMDVNEKLNHKEQKADVITADLMQANHRLEEELIMARKCMQAICNTNESMEANNQLHIRNLQQVINTGSDLQQQLAADIQLHFSSQQQQIDDTSRKTSQLEQQQQQQSQQICNDLQTALHLQQQESAQQVRKLEQQTYETFLAKQQAMEHIQQNVESTQNQQQHLVQQLQEAMLQKDEQTDILLQQQQDDYTQQIAQLKAENSTKEQHMRAEVEQLRNMVMQLNLQPTGSQPPQPPPPPNNNQFVIPPNGNNLAVPLNTSTPVTNSTLQQTNALQSASNSGPPNNPGGAPNPPPVSLQGGGTSVQCKYGSGSEFRLFLPVSTGLAPTSVVAAERQQGVQNMRNEEM